MPPNDMDTAGRTQLIGDIRLNRMGRPKFLDT